MSQLSASDLCLWRGPFCLFDELSFSVAPGQALVVRGPNGSGKTTLLRVLCGLTRPDAGDVRWDGVGIELDRRNFGATLAYFGHTLGLKADLTVTQNLSFAACLNGRPVAALANILGNLDLEDCADLEVRYLSAGQKRRTALARVLTSGAKLWVLDEPFTHLDHEGHAFIETRLNEHLGAGGLAALAMHHSLVLPAGEMVNISLGADT
jgi:heme exporter protein A